MVVALLVLMALLGLAGIIAWILAIRLSYRVERQRDPGLPQQRLVMTNMFRSAFWSAPDDRADPAMRRRLQVYIYAALGCLLAIALTSFALPLLPETERTAVAEAPARPDPTGLTLSYIRSNQDGTLPERILMHVVSPTEVHVAKMVSPCSDAAYVTGEFDAATGEATRLVGGRLTREGGQNPQAFLTLAPETRKLDVRFGNPASDPVEVHDAPPAPWRMYDFDLAEFALFGPVATADFTYGVALAWPDGTSPALRILGLAQADFLYSSDNGARNHFRIFGPAFTDPTTGNRGGELITDARSGHVIEARLGRPNHTGYTNFMMKLVEATPAPEGANAWRSALAAHWANCPVDESGG
jgi:hypothetical protein